jgi:hypothetical protein
LFYTPALAIQGFGGIWDSGVRFYPGDEIALVMENGTDYIDYWLALWKEPYETGPLTTGGDLYNYFVLNFLPASYDPSGNFYNPAYAPAEDLVNTTEPVVVPTPQQSWSIRSSRAYPSPDVRQEGLAVLSDGVVSGYFLPQVNAATLSIPSFAQYSDSIGDFSGAVSDFISNTTKQGLKIVVIDLQQNTGGTVELAFSTFKRFFPNVDPYAGSRRRNHHLGGIIGEPILTMTTFWLLNGWLRPNSTLQRAKTSLAGLNTQDLCWKRAIPSRSQYVASQVLCNR